MNFVGLATAILNATGRWKRHRIFNEVSLSPASPDSATRPPRRFPRQRHASCQPRYEGGIDVHLLKIAIFDAQTNTRAF
jgi:hypothetical protein